MALPVESTLRVMLLVGILGVVVIVLGVLLLLFHVRLRLLLLLLTQETLEEG